MSEGAAFCCTFAGPTGSARPARHENAIVTLDRSQRASTALAKIDPRLDGVFLVGKPAAFRTQFGRVQQISRFEYSDEELFIAHDGSCGLFTFEVGDSWLIVPSSRK